MHSRTLLYGTPSTAGPLFIAPQQCRFCTQVKFKINFTKVTKFDFVKREGIETGDERNKK
jgi:hypothetical protein